MRKASTTSRAATQSLRGGSLPFPWPMILIATGILGVGALALRSPKRRR
jgi:hypothetical protein